MCTMPSVRSSFWKSVSPLHAAYCLPWSVRRSLGQPYADTARRSASITSELF